MIAHGFIAASRTVHAAGAEDRSCPAAFACADGSRITLDKKREIVVIWLKADRTLLLPARYA